MVIVVVFSYVFLLVMAGLNDIWVPESAGNFSQNEGLEKPQRGGHEPCLYLREKIHQELGWNHHLLTNPASPT